VCALLVTAQPADQRLTGCVLPTRYTQFGAYVGGGWGVAALYMTVRFVESHWFTWVTQMNHGPKDVDYNKQKPWVQLQVLTPAQRHRYGGDASSARARCRSSSPR
jgi:hypothetical protein